MVLNWVVSLHSHNVCMGSSRASEFGHRSLSVFLYPFFVHTKISVAGQDLGVCGRVSVAVYSTRLYLVLGRAWFCHWCLLTMPAAFGSGCYVNARSWSGLLGFSGRWLPTLRWRLPLPFGPPSHCPVCRRAPWPSWCLSLLSDAAFMKRLASSDWALGFFQLGFRPFQLLLNWDVVIECFVDRYLSVKCGDIEAHQCMFSGSSCIHLIFFMKSSAFVMWSSVMPTKFRICCAMLLARGVRGRSYKGRLSFTNMINFSLSTLCSRTKN